MKALLTLFLSLSLLFSSAVMADKPEIFANRKSVAIKGSDVVAYYSLPEGAPAVKGSKAFTSEYNGATWHFANKENKALFDSKPEKYVPQYGGYCAFAVAHGFVTSSRPDSWKIVDGKLYLNNNKRSFDKWEADQSQKIRNADENWPAVLTK